MPDSARPVFLTGGTGVLGRAVLPLLTAAGFQARALSRSPQNALSIRKLGGEPVEANLNQPSDLRRAVAGCGAILHLATHIPPTSEMRRPNAWAQNDFLRREVTRALVEAAAAEDVSVFIYPSVCRVYPDSGDRWIDAESSTTQGAGLVQSTLEAEEHVMGFGQSAQALRAVVREFPESRRRSVVLRMGQFYGPESAQTMDEIRMARWGLVAPFGRPEAYRCVIWIEDAATAITAGLASLAGGIYDVVDDAPLTCRESIAALASAVGKRKLFRLPRWVVKSAVGPDLFDLIGRSQRVSNRRTKGVLGWRPIMTCLPEGLARLTRPQ